MLTEQKQQERFGVNDWTMYLSREKEYIEILDDNMFNIKVTYIFIAMIFLALVCLIIKLIKDGKKKVKLNFNKRINIIFVPAIVYWFTVTLTSPYIDIRYLLPIFVFVLIIILYILKKELYVIIKNKKRTFVILTLICIIFINPLWGNKYLAYQYKGNKEIIQNIEKYTYIPCIYVYDENTVLQDKFTRDLNYVRRFKNVYIMDRNDFKFSNIKNILEEIDISNGIIIMDSKDNTNIMARKLVIMMDEFKRYEIIEAIDTDRIFPEIIYYIH